MIDTSKYEGHTEGKWHCETGAHGKVQDGASIELVSFHSKEFREKWLSDASMRHDEQQDEDSIGDRAEDWLTTHIAHVYHPFDEGMSSSSYFDCHNRFVPDEIWQKEQKANMLLIQDAPLLLAEVKRLTRTLELIGKNMEYDPWMHTLIKDVIGFEKWQVKEMKKNDKDRRLQDSIEK